MGQGGATTAAAARAAADRDGEHVTRTSASTQQLVQSQAQMTQSQAQLAQVVSNLLTQATSSGSEDAGARPRQTTPESFQPKSLGEEVSRWENWAFPAKVFTGYLDSEYLTELKIAETAKLEDMQMRAYAKDQQD